MFETADPGSASASNYHAAAAAAAMGNDGTNRNTAAESSPAATFRHEGIGAPHHHQHFQPSGSPYNASATAPGFQEHQPPRQQAEQSAAAGSLNAFLNGAYASGPVAGGKLREGGGDSARDSSVGGGVGGVGGVGGAGAGGLSVFGGGGDTPLPLRQLDGPLRQLIETKERELHEIHDFRIRCACVRVCVRWLVSCVVVALRSACRGCRVPCAAVCYCGSCSRRYVHSSVGCGRRCSGT